jgi:hypothetical protein
MLGSGFAGGFSNNLGDGGGFGGGFYAPRRAGEIVTDGLVLHYDIGNASSYPGSGGTVTDLVGNSNATLYNGPTYNGGYLTFDGSNDTLITNTSLAAKVTTDITSIMMWAYPMDNGVLLSEVGTSALPNTAGWHETQMEMVSGMMKFGMWNGTEISSVTSAVATPLNAWYHFAIVYDGTKLNAYVNGAAAGSVTFSRLNPIEGGNGLFYAIAATDITNMGDGTYASMRLGQFLVYNTALSATEIQTNFNAGRTTYGV